MSLFADPVVETQAMMARLGEARLALSNVVFGQEAVIDRCLITLLCGGHGLLIGLPGLAKTRLVSALGVVLGLDTKRVQFTPDLMPSDILGAEVLEESVSGSRAFRFIKGPVFTQLLMADEINRASPRTQSALLQAMQEQHVTIAGEAYDLPQPFAVFATQNPLEQEGTYPLPEAQLDRFLMQIDVDYPSLDAEKRMILATTGQSEPKPTVVFSSSDLSKMQARVREMPVGEAVVDYILALVRKARPDGGKIGALLNWGPGPRASQALMLAVRAKALLDGRFAPALDDVADLAAPVLKHRMALTFAARSEGHSIDSVIKALLA